MGEYYATYRTCLSEINRFVCLHVSAECRQRRVEEREKWRVREKMEREMGRGGGGVERERERESSKTSLTLGKSQNRDPPPYYVHTLLPVQLVTRLYYLKQLPSVLKTQQ